MVAGSSKVAACLSCSCLSAPALSSPTSNLTNAMPMQGTAGGFGTQQAKV